MYKGLSASSRIWASITHIKYSSKFGGTICVDECHSGILEICFTFLVFSVFPAPDSPVTRMDWFFPKKNNLSFNRNVCTIIMAAEKKFWLHFIFINVCIIKAKNGGYHGWPCFGTPHLRSQKCGAVPERNTECENTNTKMEKRWKTKFWPHFSSCQNKSWRRWRCRWGTCCDKNIYHTLYIAYHISYIILFNIYIVCGEPLVRVDRHAEEARVCVDQLTHISYEGGGKIYFQPSLIS